MRSNMEQRKYLIINAAIKKHTLAYKFITGQIWLGTQ
jgi:hypothetical protein